MSRLVLTRRVNEKIIIGNNKEVTICILGIYEYKGALSVRIGLEADRSVQILREEVMLRDTNKEISEQIDDSDEQE